VNDVLKPVAASHESRVSRRSAKHPDPGVTGRRVNDVDPRSGELPDAALYEQREHQGPHALVDARQVVEREQRDVVAAVRERLSQQHRDPRRARVDVELVMDGEDDSHVSARDPFTSLGPDVGQLFTWWSQNALTRRLGQQLR